MKKLLNTLYVTSQLCYLSLEGENIVVNEEGKEIGRVPLHNLESIVSFGYKGTSPALMGKCVENNISIIYLNPNGKFLARIVGGIHGNVLLRIAQHEFFMSEEKSLSFAKNIILAKVYNARWIIERFTRDHNDRVDVNVFKNKSNELKNALANIKKCKSKEELRGYEGEAARTYFGIFDSMILQQKDQFTFKNRNKRPPEDFVNTLLSFVYTLLTNMVTSSLETVGLDPYIGFMHTLRPGRVSLSLDMVEELRHVVGDRFVLTLINKKIINSKSFVQKENGAVILKDDARKKILVEWQNKKKETITHPFIKEKIEWGIVPYVQSMLLARFLRGDLDEYPPFMWK